MNRSSPSTQVQSTVIWLQSTVSNLAQLAHALTERAVKSLWDFADGNIDEPTLKSTLGTLSKAFDILSYAGYKENTVSTNWKVVQKWMGPSSTHPLSSVALDAETWLSRWLTAVEYTCEAVSTQYNNLRTLHSFVKDEYSKLDGIAGAKVKFDENADKAKQQEAQDAKALDHNINWLTACLEMLWDKVCKASAGMQ